MTSRQKITPHLWFDQEAKEAAGFYASVFPDSRVKATTRLDNTPSGSVDMLTIDILGQEFALINAGPYFKINPSISFMISCQSKEEVDAWWGILNPGGTPLIALGQYPFSPWYGWIQDKFGVSWQLGFMPDRPLRPRITPTLLFAGQAAGQAEAAIQAYVRIFRKAQVGDIHRYEKGEEPEQEGTVKYAEFTLEGQKFAAMDSHRGHVFTFNEAVSLMVHCDTQTEIDYYWSALTADPGAEQCGWLKDKFGISWQIVPTAMERMLATPDPQKLARVTEAFLHMKKFEIAELEKAYTGKA